MSGIPFDSTLNPARGSVDTFNPNLCGNTDANCFGLEQQEETPRNEDCLPAVIDLKTAADFDIESPEKPVQHLSRTRLLKQDIPLKFQAYPPSPTVRV